jgi:hypothetical protein
MRKWSVAWWHHRASEFREVFVKLEIGGCVFFHSLIGVSAFGKCSKLQNAALLQNCIDLHQITLAVGSQLRCIRSEAFSRCPLKKVVVPESVREIGPSVFSDEVWRKCIRFEGPPLFLIDREFIRSVDSRVVFLSLSDRKEVLIPANVEVIGAKAFERRKMSPVTFESGTRLKAIGSGHSLASKQ